ncbi:MAG: hypothetical protein L0H79_17165, partial [Intrasporangium sp.]|uniref:hypothetical protein n=1 Tax=Intrasporangium sp. TaxID=1925024 RepID=UPI00264A0C1A
LQAAKPAAAAADTRAVLLRPRPAAAPPRPVAATTVADSPGSRDSDEDPVALRSGAKRMVEALGRMAPLRLTKGQWGMVARLKTTGGTWSTYLSDIRRLGFLDETGAGYTLTDAGFDYLGGRPEPMSALELQSHYRSILRAGAAKMLDALIDAYPTALTREELGTAVDIVTTGGTFSTYLSDLIRNGLAERQGGALVATPILMHGSQA